MIYSLKEGVGENSCNYWEARIDTRTGEPREKPKRLTNWAGTCMNYDSATADGKRLAFRKWSWQGNVYVADLEANGTRLTTPRRLTLNEGRNYPVAWTPDSRAVIFASYRDDQWGVFKQRLDEGTAETIATRTRGEMVGTRLSPDGAWIFYLSPSPYRLRGN